MEHGQAKSSIKAEYGVTEDCAHLASAGRGKAGSLACTSGWATDTPPLRLRERDFAQEIAELKVYGEGSIGESRSV